MRNYSMLDKALINLDCIVRSFSQQAISPAAAIENEFSLNIEEHEQSVQMMRINHGGEICAQALYQGQALMTRSNTQYAALMQAADEEIAHLSWCRQRLKELNARPSLLAPFWYAGSFAIGAAAGLAGDAYSLGFLAETEYQVTRHLDLHLQKMSDKDQKSRAILQQMREDELKHATNAEANGARELPPTIKALMRLTAKVLTVSAAKL